LAVLAIQAALSIRLLWANTAFNDEALYLWSGHWEIAHLLHGTAIPQFQRYFSGAPVIYPIIGALAAEHGGLTAARLLSLAFMLGTTLLLYGATSRLFGRRAGICAAALFAFLGPVQFLGSFATYDAMAIFLLALSSWLVIRAQGQASEALLIVAAELLALADATKYATALWDPVVILLAALTARGGWLRGSFRALRLLAYTGAVIYLLVRLGGRSYMAGILVTTLARQAGGVPPGNVLRDAAPWIGIVLLLALRAVVIARGRREQLLCALLAAAVLLAPLEQARIHTLTSLEKHVAFGAWFGAIAAGYVLARAVEDSKYWKWRIVPATAAVVLGFGMLQANTFDARWPDAARATAAMRHVAQGTRRPILAEEAEIFRYYLGLPPGARLFTLKGFYYWDVAERKELTGIPALRLAISRHYFDVIELDFYFPDELSYEMATLDAVRANPGYRLIARIPWRDGSGSNFFMIWRYEPSSGGPR
jgi:4-amino-4-deoxy-L-arabinose transferase-like glycosyltransferase